MNYREKSRASEGFLVRPILSAGARYFVRTIACLFCMQLIPNHVLAQSSGFNVNITSPSASTVCETAYTPATSLYVSTTCGGYVNKIYFDSITNIATVNGNNIACVDTGVPTSNGTPTINGTPNAYGVLLQPTCSRPVGSMALSVVSGNCVTFPYSQTVTGVNCMSANSQWRANQLQYNFPANSLAVNEILYQCTTQRATPVLPASDTMPASNWIQLFVGTEGNVIFADCNTTNPVDFTMVFMSDPQFHWDCTRQHSQDQYYTSDFCQDSRYGSLTIRQGSVQSNYMHLAALNMIMGQSTNTYPFMGVVVNGDITADSNLDGSAQLDDYTKIYGSFIGKVWPGLGNHDYENMIDDCGAKSWANYNYCSAEMMHWLLNYFQNYAKAGYVNNSMDISYAQNTGQAGGQINMKGSMAYSWDIGQFHFVQLNNYPQYAKKFERGYESGISSWTIDITSPGQWLQTDLRNAVARNRTIVLNWHKFLDIYGAEPTLTASESAQRAALVNMLQPYSSNIAAIFVGHHHSQWGYSDYLEIPSASSSTSRFIPVIYGGSAITNHFVKAVFTSVSPCQIATTPINTYVTFTTGAISVSPPKPSTYSTGPAVATCTPSTVQPTPHPD